MNRQGKLRASLMGNLELNQLLHDKQFMRVVVNLWQLVLQLTHNGQQDQGADAQRKTFRS